MMRVVFVLAALGAPAYLSSQSVPAISPSGIVLATDSSSAYEGLAPGSLFTIYGSGFALGTARADPPYPTKLAGATVHFRSGTTVVDAPLLYVSPSQINGVTPSGAPGSEAYVSVETVAGESSRISVPLVDSRFTAFTTEWTPFGPVVVQQYRPSGITLNRLLDPAAPGDALVIWGTGLASEHSQDVTVYIGDAPVTPFYAGPSPGQPGLSQVNFYLPAGTPSRCYMPIAVRTGSWNSAEYTISTAAVGTSECKSDITLNREARQTLDGGGTIQLLALSVAGSDSRFRSAEAWLGRYSSAYLSQVATYDMPGAAPGVSCTRRRYNTLDPPARSAYPAPLYGIDRTFSLIRSVTGNSGCSWHFSPHTDAVYRAYEPEGGCPAQGFELIVPSTGAWLSGTLPAVPAAAAPEIHLTRSAGGASVSWVNPSGARLTLGASSSFRFPGGAFYTINELTCRLSGSSGSGEISYSDSLFVAAFSGNQWYDLRPAAAIFAPWAAPTIAALARASMTLSGPLRLE